MKTSLKAIVISALAIGFASANAQAATIATWTFESSVPTTAGPIAPEVGSGTATGSHAAGAAVYSNPAGNGSNESFSADNWQVGDYWQFSVSSAGFSNIALSWDQTSSNTGPRDFTLAYSTNGTTFTNLLSYSVLANATPNPTWSATTPHPEFHFTQDLSSLLGVNNQTSLIFRLTDASTVSANGGAIGTAGTDRVDNFSVSGTAVAAVPVPAAVWLLGSALMGLTGLRRRQSV